MNKQNDLSGLTNIGFENLNENFDPNIFVDSKVIDSVRSEISKYFSKTISNNSTVSSYKLKHKAERHIGAYVSNGEFIYAMHLEGFEIFRDSINCHFNIKNPDFKVFEHARKILDILSKPIVHNIDEYIRVLKIYQKYKYNLRLIIDNSFSQERILKRDVLKVISKEIGEDLPTIKYWVEMQQNDETTIPNEKMKLLEKLFSLSSNQLANNSTAYI
jgi:hypothetical protein